MKKKIIFLPGMMCDKRVFAPQIEKFKNSFDIEVASLSGTHSIPKMAENILKKIAGKSFYCCGLSLGGILAMELIKQASVQIEGVILFDTNHLMDTPERKSLRQQQIERVKSGAEVVFLEIIRDEMKPFYLENKNNAKAKIFQKLFLDMAQDLGKKVFLEQSQALKDREGYEDTLKNWRKPTLIVCGSQDRLCPPERHKMMEKLIRGNGGVVDFHVIKRAGHIVNLEKPDEFNLLMDRWFLNQ